jgi:hypothetical protein
MLLQKKAPSPDISRKLVDLCRKKLTTYCEEKHDDIETRLSLQNCERELSSIK